MATNDSIPPEQGAHFDASAIDQWPTIPEQAVPDLVTQPSMGVIQAPTGTRMVPTGAIKSGDAKDWKTVGAGGRDTLGPYTPPTTTSDERDAKSMIGRGVMNHVPTTPIIAVRGLTKTYFLGQTQVRALRGVSLEVYPGEFVAIMGPSGSGKSTFMNLVGCLDRPTEGEYWLAGKLVSSMSSDELADMRNRLLGFVFQGFNLLGRATALANAALPLVYAGLSKGARTRRARAVLKVVGLGSRMNHKPAQLSGGQQQRVAIARALVNGPALLLADEPTGNLDSRTSLEVIAVLQALNQQGLTIVMVTHDTDVAAFTKRQVGFLDGRIVRDERVLVPRSAQTEWTALVETKPRKGVIDHVPTFQVHIKEEPK